MCRIRRAKTTVGTKATILKKKTKLKGALRRSFFMSIYTTYNKNPRNCNFGAFLIHTNVRTRIYARRVLTIILKYAKMCAKIPAVLYAEKVLR